MLIDVRGDTAWERLIGVAYIGKADQFVNSWGGPSGAQAQRIE